MCQKLILAAANSCSAVNDGSQARQSLPRTCSRVLTPLNANCSAEVAASLSSSCYWVLGAVGTPPVSFYRQINFVSRSFTCWRPEGIAAWAWILQSSAPSLRYLIFERASLGACQSWTMIRPIYLQICIIHYGTLKLRLDSSPKSWSDRLSGQLEGVWGAG